MEITYYCIPHSDCLVGQGGCGRGGPPLEFGATADTYVESASPAVNFGGSTAIAADASPVRIIYLRFAVNGIGGQPISGAVLRLQADSASASGSDHGGAVQAISNSSWQEATVTYETRPAVDGPVLATHGAVVPDDVVEFDVTAALAGDGVYNFAIDTPSTNGCQYRSREASAGGPRLVVTVGQPSTTTTTTTVPDSTTTTLPDVGYEDFSFGAALCQ